MDNRIEEYRKPLGLSQHRLGKKIGISRVSINKIETGKTVPTLKFVHITLLIVAMEVPLNLIIKQVVQ